METKPILMNGDMVRATLAGTKTQTRRLDGLAEVNKNPDQCFSSRFDEVVGQWLMGCTGGSFYIKPRWVVGDHLYVRETCLGWWNSADKSFSHVAAYKADGYELEAGEKWIPSIHMPRKASRITLEVVAVRLERLQSITEEDAAAEGLIYQDGDGTGPWPGYKWVGRGYHGGLSDKSGYKNFHVPDPDGNCGCLRSKGVPARCAFSELWDRIYGKGDSVWDHNPWVFVVEFRRII